MSFLYDPFKESMLGAGTRIDLDADTIRAAIGRTDQYTALTSHQFMSSLTVVQGADAALGSITITNGVFDAADSLFSSVPAQAGNNPINFMVIYKDVNGITGNASPVICYLDGFSIVANGGNITMVYDNGSNKIFRL